LVPGCLTVHSQGASADRSKNGGVVNNKNDTNFKNGLLDIDKIILMVQNMFIYFCFCKKNFSYKSEFQYLGSFRMSIVLVSIVNYTTTPQHSSLLHLIKTFLKQISILFTVLKLSLNCTF